VFAAFAAYVPVGLVAGCAKNYFMYAATKPHSTYWPLEPLACEERGSKG
jgi:hypothetical protein